jgi:hypothetical protein
MMSCYVRVLELLMERLGAIKRSLAGLTRTVSPSAYLPDLGVMVFILELWRIIGGFLSSQLCLDIA